MKRALAPVPSLSQACAQGDFAVAEALVASGAKSYNANHGGMMMIKAIAGSCDDATASRFVELLTSIGADANYDRAMKPKTTLDAAIGKNYRETCKLLLRKGVTSINVSDNDKEELFMACYNHEIERVERWLEVRPAVRGPEYVEAMFCALAREDPNFEKEARLLDLLLAKGADVDARCKPEGIPLLHDACHFGSGYPGAQDPEPRLVRFLLQKGASFNVMYDGMTALGYVIWTFSREFLYGEPMLYAHPYEAVALECVKILLEHGADVDAGDGETPLHLACNTEDYRFKPHLIRLLAENGADLNAAKRKDGRTALHDLCAASLNEYYFDGDDGDDDDHVLERFNNYIVECVKILLEHGAEVDVCDLTGELPIVLAENSGKDEVANLLRDYKLQRACFDYDDDEPINCFETSGEATASLVRLDYDDDIEPSSCFETFISDFQDFWS